MTAVEFLHSEYMKIFGELNPSTGKLVEIAYALEQAKEMEKEQQKDYAFYKKYWEVRNLKKNELNKSE